MTEGQIAALVWGLFAVPFGAMFIVKREAISAAARKQREQQGIKLTERTQSPLLMAFGGAVLICAGVAMVIASLTGALR
ncbi:hypothetical protein ACFVAJ_20115 [Agromyces sp. NPDC057679]|uniref:hypothetical protein n=1 Tax=Agromyces sp. NPDC057679 TaxID=3346207 RepID=UPI00366ECEF4